MVGVLLLVGVAQAAGAARPTQGGLHSKNHWRGAHLIDKYIFLNPAHLPQRFFLRTGIALKRCCACCAACQEEEERLLAEELPVTSAAATAAEMTAAAAAAGGSGGVARLFSPYCGVAFCKVSFDLF